MQQIKTLTNAIGTFIKGNLKILIHNIFECVKHGGLNMIEIDSYINAIKVGFLS